MLYARFRYIEDWMRMDNIKKALNITGILGAAFGIFGYIGLFVDGDLGAFTGGATEQGTYPCSRLSLRERVNRATSPVHA